MPLIRPNKGYLRKYSPLTPSPLPPLRVPMMSQVSRSCGRSEVRQGHAGRNPAVTLLHRFEGQGVQGLGVEVFETFGFMGVGFGVEMFAALGVIFCRKTQGCTCSYRPWP